ncbi:unnamed protein product [Caenorhabditis bovis]|uniref:Exonuclease domain-containing protein n=1 Tax=Caenorhabditis bovis TaxID=2654633 RepID=A0A8S1EQ47_9PELO|nr:unnamed protein product [Caenorhabditis bovis]
MDGSNFGITYNLREYAPTDPCLGIPGPLVANPTPPQPSPPVSENNRGPLLSDDEYKTMLSALPIGFNLSRYRDEARRQLAEHHKKVLNLMEILDPEKSEDSSSNPPTTSNSVKPEPYDPFESQLASSSSSAVDVKPNVKKLRMSVEGSSELTDERGRVIPQKLKKFCQDAAVYVPTKIAKDNTSIRPNITIKKEPSSNFNSNDIADDDEEGDDILTVRRKKIVNERLGIVECPPPAKPKVLSIKRENVDVEIAAPTKEIADVICLSSDDESPQPSSSVSPSLPSPNSVNCDASPNRDLPNEQRATHCSSSSTARHITRKPDRRARRTGSPIKSTTTTKTMKSPISCASSDSETDESFADEVRTPTNSNRSNRGLNEAEKTMRRSKKSTTPKPMRKRVVWSDSDESMASSPSSSSSSVSYLEESYSESFDASEGSATNSDTDSMKDFIVDEDEDDERYRRRKSRRGRTQSSEDEYLPSDVEVPKRRKKKKKSSKPLARKAGASKRARLSPALNTRSKVSSKTPSTRRTRKEDSRGASNSKEEKLQGRDRSTTKERMRPKDKVKSKDTERSKSKERKRSRRKENSTSSQRNDGPNVKQERKKTLLEIAAERRRIKVQHAIQRVEEKARDKMRLMLSVHPQHMKEEEAFRKSKERVKKIEKTRRLTDEGPSNKKTRIDAVAEEPGEDVNAPPKRIAHTPSGRSSSGSSSKIVPPPLPMSRKRVFYEENYKKSFEEAERRSKQAAEEAERLKNKKYLTQEEMFGEKRSRIGSTAKGEARVSRPINALNPKVRVKMEPPDSPTSAKKKKLVERAPPKPLEPFCTKVSIASRQNAIAAIFKEVLGTETNEPEKEAQRLELEALHGGNPTHYMVRVTQKIKNLRNLSNQVVIPVSSHHGMMTFSTFDRELNTCPSIDKENRPESSWSSSSSPSKPPSRRDEKCRMDYMVTSPGGFNPYPSSYMLAHHAAPQYQAYMPTSSMVPQQLTTPPPPPPPPPPVQRMVCDASHGYVHHYASPPPLSQQHLNFGYYAVQTQNHYLGAPFQNYTGVTYLTSQHQILRSYPSSPESPKDAVSHDAILCGPKRDKISIGVHRKNREKEKKIDDYTPEELYEAFGRFRQSESVLTENGYPYFISASRRVKIEKTIFDKIDIWIDDHDRARVCCRCKAEFRLNPDGTIPRQEAVCRYHNRGAVVGGKRDTFRKVHACCKEDWSHEGCKLSDIHVFDQQPKSELDKFIATPPPTGPNDPRSKKMFAIDCEMVYTMRGPALARLSVVDINNVSVLDVRVKPPGEVLDANTEFSGLTIDEVNAAEFSLEECREKLFKLINSETILIGHSLESDLKALRLAHLNVIDTAIVFQNGGGNKKALRSLAAEHLKQFIQQDNDEITGHDSNEDARVCMELLKYRLQHPV